MQLQACPNIAQHLLSSTHLVSMGPDDRIFARLDIVTTVSDTDEDVATTVADDDDVATTVADTEVDSSPDIANLDDFHNSDDVRVGALAALKDDAADAAHDLDAADDPDAADGQHEEEDEAAGPSSGEAQRSMFQHNSDWAPLGSLWEEDAADDHHLMNGSCMLAADCDRMPPPPPKKVRLMDTPPPQLDQKKRHPKYVPSEMGVWEQVADIL